MKEISNVREFTGQETDPPIKTLISNIEIAEKQKIVDYLKSYKADCAAGMSLVDEITGETTTLGVEGYEDKEYFWDAREIYHFEQYNLELDEDFVKHVLNK